MDKEKLTSEENNLIILFNSDFDSGDLTKLISENKNLKVIDKFALWLKEAFIVAYPKYKNDKNLTTSSEYKNFCEQNNINLENPETSGVWVLFKWKNELVHLLPENLHYRVITARNGDLVSREEQNNFYKTKVAIAGLSVGQSAALTIATTGGSKSMNLGDFDKLDATNLNRIKATVSEIDDYKCDIVAKQIYSINPFANLNLFYDGVNLDNINNFVSDASLIIDEIDNFQIKANLRQKAKEKKIPLVSAFDTADGIVLDVERYDTLPSQKPFFGKLTEDQFLSLVKEAPNPHEIPKLVIGTYGEETIPDLFKSSIIKVGSKLAGVPQLGSTAFFAGAVLSYAVRMISSGENLVGRYYLDLRELTGLKYRVNLTNEEREVFQKITS